MFTIFIIIKINLIEENNNKIFDFLLPFFFHIQEIRVINLLSLRIYQIKMIDLIIFYKH